MEVTMEAPMTDKGAKTMIAAEKIKIYPNERIAGASDDVARVTINQEFAFDGFTIIVENVLAFRDNKTGTQYVPGGLAMVISDAVMELAMAIQREQADRTEPLPALLQHIRLTAPPMTSAMM